MQISSLFAKPHFGGESNGLDGEWCEAPSPYGQASFLGSRAGCVGLRRSPLHRNRISPPSVPLSFVPHWLLGRPTWFHTPI